MREKIKREESLVSVRPCENNTRIMTGRWTPNLVEHPTETSWGYTWFFVRYTR